MRFFSFLKTQQSRSPSRSLRDQPPETSAAHMASHIALLKEALEDTRTFPSVASVVAQIRDQNSQNVDRKYEPLVKIESFFSGTHTLLPEATQKLLAIIYIRECIAEDPNSIFEIFTKEIRPSLANSNILKGHGYFREDLFLKKMKENYSDIADKFDPHYFKDITLDWLYRQSSSSSNVQDHFLDCKVSLLYDHSKHHQSLWKSNTPAPWSGDDFFEFKIPTEQLKIPVAIE